MSKSEYQQLLMRYINLGNLLMNAVYDDHAGGEPIKP